MSKELPVCSSPRSKRPCTYRQRGKELPDLEDRDVESAFLTFDSLSHLCVVKWDSKMLNNLKKETYLLCRLFCEQRPGGSVALDTEDEEQLAAYINVNAQHHFLKSNPSVCPITHIGVERYVKKKIRHLFQAKHLRIADESLPHRSLHGGDCTTKRGYMPSKRIYHH